MVLARGVLPHSLGGGVPLGSRKSYPLGAGQKVKREVGRREMGGGSPSFKPCKGVGHPIFLPVVVGWVMIASDKV